MKGVEEEERRRHPCVLHLIRPPIEGYKLHQREGERGRELKNFYTSRKTLFFFKHTPPPNTHKHTHTQP